LAELNSRQQALTTRHSIHWPSENRKRETNFGKWTTTHRPYWKRTAS